MEAHHLAEHAHQFGEAIAAFIEVQGMVAENQCRIHAGLSPAYDEKAFNEVANRYGIEYNSLIGKKRAFY